MGAVVAAAAAPNFFYWSFSGRNRSNLKPLPEAAMRRPGRKSAASLSIVPPWALQPPEPPRRLSREERTIWRELVAPFRADHFHGAAHLVEALVGVVGIHGFLVVQ